MLYRGKNGRPVTKKEWIEEWDKLMLLSGWQFILDIAFLRKRTTKQEMTDLSPDESVCLCTSPAKELWESAQKKGLSIIETLKEWDKEKEHANKSGR